jgi:serine/threonine-protein kinase
VTLTAERLRDALAGRYRIERELGAGGMATVYLAQDLRHDRNVAIKVLKPELAAVLGADRFVQEIKTTASLSHPHILPLFDSGTADGFLFYVMPYIQGETIREKLNRETQFGVDEAVRIAREVADALDYAHRHGVIHRDIKPENILLHDGRAMVMDFGIALAVSAAAGGRMTETGLSLGTPHYMSPEQATADKEISGRSDVYSLASVLYEMLAGNPPHVGSSAQQIIMKIIADTPRPVTELRKSVPPNVAAALAKALEKLPADRFDSAKTFHDALGNASFTTTASAGGLPATAGSSGALRSALIAAVTVAVVASIGLVWALQRKPTDASNEPVVRVAVDLPPGERLYASSGSNVAISPQGDHVVYLAQGAVGAGGAFLGARLMIRRTSELGARELVSAVVTQPAFSPDGRWVVFTDGNQVSKVPNDGGAILPLANLPNGNVRGFTWLRTDTIVMGSDLGLLAFPSRGGAPRRLPGVDSTVPAIYPIVMPDGENVAFTTGGNAATRRLVVTSLTTRRSTVLEIAAAMAVGMREGHLLYVTSAGALNAIPFDLKQQRATGDPIQVENGIRLSAAGAALVGLSENGSLWYVTGQSTGNLVRVAPGRPDVPVLNEQRGFKSPRLSPDGRTIAVEVATAVGSDIWLHDLASGTFTPLTTDGKNNSIAEWSPDSKRVVFRSVRDDKLGVWWQPADGSGAAELLYQPADPINEIVMSPDGKWLLYRTAPGLRNRDIFAVPLDGDRKPILLVGGPAQESHPRVSPDNKWLAYQSNESGRFEIYVKPFPTGGARVQISNEGGAEPIWSKSGGEIFYRSLTGGVESAEVKPATPFIVGNRRSVLPPSDYLSDISHTSYDVWPDGKSFLMVKPASGGDARPILVHNWGRELREKLAAGKP